jgi:hypothetical protein
VKIFVSGLFTIPTSILLLNLYKHQYYQESLDLDEILKTPSKITVEFIDVRNDPFELIKDFNVEEYYLDTLSTALYNPPLTLKLFPKSNLYGHELIRYYDL